MLTEHSSTGGAGSIRKSKNAKRRAIVLAIIQLLIIVHIVLWLLSKKYGWWGGKTLSPIEPSESMEFVKDGVINAGLVFFALALLSTLILGRWFCGWGCHVVMLQDLCGWMMKKVGVRPKPFRSRFLIYVPLLLALYMFVWPAAYRWGIAPLSASLSKTFDFIPDVSNVPPWPATGEFQNHLVTDDFWRTFPGWVVAIPFLLICGFATVYFLGAKGFCTYGCPYGGFFRPLDRFAPARIVVSDACEGCGHCTAVCTSNVRVHEEVREYGMVVDPGCMKCLDCVSVCPNEALSFGFAKPALLKGKPKNAAPKRVYDLSLAEEFAMAGVFALTFFAFRGDLIRFPLLMSAGVAGVLTFMAWKLWRLVRDPNVTLYRRQFKLKGSIKRAGWTFIIIAGIALLVTINIGLVNAAFYIGQWQESKLTIRPDVTFSGSPQPMAEDMIPHADRAIALYRMASWIGDGGIGFFRTRATDLDLGVARLLSEQLKFDEAEVRLRRALQRDPHEDRLVASLMWVLEAQQQRSDAITFGKTFIVDHATSNEAMNSFQTLALRNQDAAIVEEVSREFIDRHGVTDQALLGLLLSLYLQERIEESAAAGEKYLEHPAPMQQSLDFFRRTCLDLAQPDRCISLLKRRLELMPDDLYAMRLLSLLLLDHDRIDEGIAVTRRTIEIDPRNGSAFYVLGMALAHQGQTEEALAALTRASELTPNSVPINTALADMLAALGRTKESERYREQARRAAEAVPRAH